ncbi:hypothetical protein PLICRDRAFT_85756, partial [Plicaturopsis crispa FD-325 SS-3]
GDGSDWTVGEDWEVASGLVHDIFLTTVSPDIEALRQRLKDEPIFREVIDAIHNLDPETDVRTRKRARHRAEGYMIEDGKLWKIANGKSPRAESRRECVSKAEAVELGRIEHGHLHFQRDSMKKNLLKKYWSPLLDQSLVKVIL